MHNKKKATARWRIATTEGEPITPVTVLRSALFALLISAPVGLLLLLLSTALLLFTPDPIRFHTPVAIGILLLTALLAGDLCARLHARRAPLFCGITTGLMLLGTTLLLPLLIGGTEHSSLGGVGVLLHALLPVLTTVGAFLGARPRNETKHRRKYA